MTRESSLEDVASRLTDRPSGVAVKRATGAWLTGAARATVPKSDAAKLRSEEDVESWCTSTATVLLPTRRAEVGTVKGRPAFSAAPERLDAARVVAVTAPAGMLSRTTSVPLTWTTAPSSATSSRVRSAGIAETWKVVR